MVVHSGPPVNTLAQKKSNLYLSPRSRPFDTAPRAADNRSVTRYRACVAALALAALFLLSACALEESSPATPAATSTNAPTVIPLPGGGAIAPGDSIALYSAAAKAAGESSGASTTAAATPDESAPVRIIHVYDLTQDKAVATLPFGTQSDPPVRAILAGDQLVTTTEHKAVVQRFDGSAQRQVYAAPPTGQVLDIAASADGRLLAVLARSEKDNPQTALVRVSYLASGGKALLIAISDPRLRAFQGSFASVSWLDNGDPTPSLIIQGASDDETHTPSSAVISLHGIVDVLQPSGPAWLAPAGTRWAMADQLVCTGTRIAGHHLVARDTGTGKVLWQTDDPTPLYSPVEWSPDGATLIYATRADTPTSCDASVQVPVQLYQVDIATGQTSAIADLAALHQDWYGRTLMTASCTTGAPVFDRWQHFASLCPDSADASSPATVSVSGTEIGKAADPVPVGIYQPKPSQSGAVSAPHSADLVATLPAS